MAYTRLLPENVTLGLTLDRYQEIMQLPEAAFNGLSKPDEEGCFECAAIWKQTDRDALAQAIANAEEMREHELGYYTAPKYLEEEEYEFGFPEILNQKMLISIGKSAQSNISLAVALVLGAELTPNDPVTIAVATTVTDKNEICLFYPGEDVEIHPSSVEISGGVATIEIPRSRLKKLTVDTNCDPAPSYYENDNFITTIDVKRCYTDVSVGAYYVWFGDCCLTGMSLTETTQLLYPKIVDKRLSIVKFFPATYSAGTWTYATPTKCTTPDSVRVSYLSGMRYSTQAEMDTARLAHTLLPGIMPDRVDLCSACWKTDILVDPSELVTPYGTSTGAVHVWMTDSRSKIGAGGKFPRVRAQV